MKISRRAKAERRAEILETARRLFCSRGFEATTTRDLAEETHIATGTLFNYFESKEALAVEVLAAALEAGRADFLARQRGDEDLAEVLFLHVITGLRRLEPYRGFVGAVLETALSPFAGGGRSGVSRVGDGLRASHLEVVEELIASRSAAPNPAGGSGRPSFVSLHLYWTLFLGVLSFWTGDDSPNQEDTLAVLDESLHLFAHSLARGPATRS